MHWFAAFLLLYALGTHFGLALLDPVQLGRRFFVIHLLIAAALALLGVGFARPFAGSTASTTVQVLVALYGLASLAVIAAPTRLSVWAPVLLGGAALGLSSGGPLLAAHLLSSGAVLGLALVAMLLGHWYLNDASLSFDPLVRICAAFLAAAIAKTLVVAWILAPTWREWWGTLTSDFDGLLILARVGSGCLASVVFAWMAYACARIKSNQSATGILYVAIVFSIVGEAISISSTLGKGRLL